MRRRTRADPRLQLRGVPQRLRTAGLERRRLLQRPHLRLRQGVPSRSGWPACSEISCLSADEQRMLNQIRGNSYCHIFAFVEEYIVPMVLDRARSDVYGDESRLRSLLRFAEEETKHQEMMDRACRQFADRIRGRVRTRTRARGSRRGRALDVAPDGIAADEHDRVVHPAPLHRARPRPCRPRRVVPRPAAVPLDRRVTPRPPRQPADRRSRSHGELPTSESRPSTSCSSSVARSTDCSRSNSSSTSSPSRRQRAHLHRRRTSRRSVHISSARTAGRSSSPACSTPTSSRSSSSSRTRDARRSPPRRRHSPRERTTLKAVHAQAGCACLHPNGHYALRSCHL